LFQHVDGAAMPQPAQDFGGIMFHFCGRKILSQTFIAPDQTSDAFQ
jgi:hypothetical protein